MAVENNQHQGLYLGYDYLVDIVGPSQEDGSDFVISISVFKDGKIVLPPCADADNTYKTYDEAVAAGVQLAQVEIKQIY